MIERDRLGDFPSALLRDADTLHDNEVLGEHGGVPGQADEPGLVRPIILLVMF